MRIFACIMSFFRSKGFTLIELLIVIAVLSVLVAGVLITLDPMEQVRRGMDSGRISSVAQLGKAMQSYYTARLIYPAVSDTWQTALLDSGEIKITASVTATRTTCSTYNQGNVCYSLNDNSTDAIIWTVLASKASFSKGSCSEGQVPVAAWYSGLGKTGITCVADAETDPSFTVTELH